MASFFRFDAFTRKPANAPSIPHGQRVWAIGDVHGRRDLLDILLDRIAQREATLEPSSVQIVFLGDLVDRGADSKGVIDRVIALAQGPATVRVLRGNHDDVFLRAVQGDVRSARHLVRMGGRETVLSYGISQVEYDSADFAGITAHLHDLVPKSHLDLLAGMESTIVIGDYLFVHAGIRPNVALEDQTDEDLYWIRNDFLNHKGAFEKFVIHGHSITDDVDIRANRIGIDTGAFSSEKLTAIGLERKQSWFLST